MIQLSNDDSAVQLHRPRETQLRAGRVEQAPKLRSLLQREDALHPKARSGGGFGAKNQRLAQHHAAADVNIEGGTGCRLNGHNLVHTDVATDKQCHPALSNNSHGGIAIDLRKVIVPCGQGQVLLVGEPLHRIGLQADACIIVGLLYIAYQPIDAQGSSVAVARRGNLHRRLGDVVGIGVGIGPQLCSGAQSDAALHLQDVGLNIATEPSIFAYGDATIAGQAPLHRQRARLDGATRADVAKHCERAGRLYLRVAADRAVDADAPGRRNGRASRVVAADAHGIVEKRLRGGLGAIRIDRPGGARRCRAQPQTTHKNDDRVSHDCFLDWSMRSREHSTEAHCGEILTRARRMKHAPIRIPQNGLDTGGWPFARYPAKQTRQQMFPSVRGG